MALFFRSSTAYEVYENALEAADIPFVTVAGRGFYDRPEIRDLLNILAAIADPTDNLALVGPSAPPPSPSLMLKFINCEFLTAKHAKKTKRFFSLAPPARAGEAFLAVLAVQ